MSFKIKIYLSHVLLPLNENMAKDDIMTESSANKTIPFSKIQGITTVQAMVNFLKLI